MMIGERIKIQREDMGWSQAELADKLGIAQDSISLWEKGRRVPNTAYVIAICKLFGVSTDYLLGYENDFGVKSYATPEPQYYSKDEQRLVETYRSLSAAKKKALLDMLEISIEIQAKNKIS